MCTIFLIAHSKEKIVAKHYICVDHKYAIHSLQHVMDFALFLFVDVLGGRLETEMDGQLKDNAGLCYICSGNVEKFVEWW